MQIVTRTLGLYTMHGHVGETPVDYVEFFRWLSGLSAPETTAKATSELRFSVAEATERDGLVSLRIVASTPNEVPLYFDFRTGQTTEGALPDGKWLARTARVVVDPASDRRSVVIESSRAGVTAYALGRYFARIARERGWADRMTFELTPVASESILEELAEFERIREAAASVSRPNIGWEDLDDGLAELAGESGGQVAEAVVRAPRGGGLSTDTGIVAIIKNAITNKTPSVRDFRVTGRKYGSKKEVTVSSAQHQVRSFVDLDVDGAIDEADARVFNASSELIRGEGASLA